MSQRPRVKTGRVVRILVDIDAILDTRLGLMDILDPETAVKLVSNPGYFTRVNDKFEALCGMPDSVFKVAWKARDKEVLKHSINTPSIDLVHYMLLEVEYRAINDPTLAGGALDVNIYPYQLTEEEKLALAAVITQRAGWQSPIRIVNQPPIYFTPALVKNDYYAVVMYDHNAWFKAHQAELFAGEVGIPGVILYAPRLVIDEVPPAELTDFSGSGMRKDLDMFDAVAQALAQYIALEYLPINQYCICYAGINDNSLNSVLPQMSPAA